MASLCWRWLGMVCHGRCDGWPWRCVPCLAGNGWPWQAMAMAIAIACIGLPWSAMAAHDYSNGWQSQAMAGPLPSLFFPTRVGAGGWGEGGARGGSWRPPLPPLTVDAVIVVVVVLTITWLRGGDEGGARGGSWRPPLPPLAVDAVIVVVAVAVSWKGGWPSQSSSSSPPSLFMNPCTNANFTLG